MRRFAVLLMIAAAGFGQVGGAAACPTGSSTECCCGPDACGCEPQPATQLAAPSCGCGDAAPAPAVPLPAQPPCGGGGSELAAAGARTPAAIAEPAPAPDSHDASPGGRTPAGPPIFLTECALLI